MNAPTSQDPELPLGRHRAAPASATALAFADLVDALDQRAAGARPDVDDQLGRADRATTEAAAWIRSFLEGARWQRASHVPARVGHFLQHRYQDWWADRSRPDPEVDWDDLAARLVFDSRRAVNLAGVRGVTLGETVQLAYALGDVDVVVDLNPTEDGAVRVEGQVLTSESQPPVTPVSVSLRGADEEPRDAELDDLSRFSFGPAHGPDLELLVHAGRCRWRLPLDPDRNR